MTQLLHQIHQGKVDPQALYPLVYSELRAMARHRMSGERSAHTLTPTDLVHNCYQRLVESPDISWRGRRYFFAAAAEAMRRILIESARRRQSQKRGGQWERVTLSGIAEKETDVAWELRELDIALDRLAKLDRSLAEVVMLRFFAGLSVKETALAMAISPRTVNRKWTAARAWLLREMGSGPV